MTIDDLLMNEMKCCWNFFQDNTNLDRNSSFFGLTRDKYPLFPEVASISATGYAMGALIVAVDNKWLSYEEGSYIAKRTIETFLYHIPNKKGFYHRYIDMNTGEKAWNSEISIIDTGILLCGALAVGEYFSEVKELAMRLYSNANWQWFTDEEKHQFRLGYKNRFYGYWDNYAEQLILYVLGSGSPSYPVDNTFNRLEKDGIVYSWFGSLFTYQYSHAWIDFRDTIWFENSVRATRANIDYCNRYKMFKGYWGLSATITKNRYSQRLGAEPCESRIKKDGTLSVSAILSSINFLPEETKGTVMSLYQKYPESFGKYGFVTSFNLRGREPWFCSEYLGIDKGITMMMLANYFNGTIWEIFMNVECAKRKRV